MSVFSRLREKILPTKVYLDPYPNSLHRDIMFCFDFEEWDFMDAEHKEQLIGWARQNLWKDKWAWRILRKVKGYDEDP